MSGLGDEDDAIAQLMELGFSIEECVKAIESEPSSIEEAASFILENKTSGGPVLRLAGNTSPAPIKISIKKLNDKTATAPTTGPTTAPAPAPIKINIKRLADQPCPESSKRPSPKINIKRLGEQNEQQQQQQQPSFSTSAVSPVKPSPPSNYVPSEEQKEKIAQLTKEKKIREAERKLVKQRMLEDRETFNQKWKDTHSSKPEGHKLGTRAPPTSNSDSARLQIRLPASGVLIESFPATATLQEVAAFLRENYSNEILTNFSFIQLFPRKSFLPDIWESSSLADLGLTPSASLVVQEIVSDSTNNSSSVSNYFNISNDAEMDIDNTNEKDQVQENNFNNNNDDDDDDDNDDGAVNEDYNSDNSDNNDNSDSDEDGHDHMQFPGLPRTLGRFGRPQHFVGQGHVLGETQESGEIAPMLAREAPVLRNQELPPVAAETPGFFSSLDRLGGIERHSDIAHRQIIQQNRQGRWQNRQNPNHMGNNGFGGGDDGNDDDDGDDDDDDDDLSEDDATSSISRFQGAGFVLGDEEPMEIDNQNDSNEFDDETHNSAEIADNDSAAANDRAAARENRFINSVLEERILRRGLNNDESGGLEDQSSFFSSTPEPDEERKAESAKPVPSLLDCCLPLVSKDVAIRASNGETFQLNQVGHMVVLEIINYLMKMGKLNVAIMNTFISCKLNRLHFDGYKYMTNDLLRGLRRHRHLYDLSLRNCPLLTDKGMEDMALNAERLESLDIGNNRLGDSTLANLEQYKNLRSLSLDSTNISSIGFADLCPKLELLEYLNVSHCRLSNADLKFLHMNKELKGLVLDHTPMSSLAHLPSLPSLVILSLNFTNLESDYALSNLHEKCPTLTKLCLKGTLLPEKSFEHLKTSSLRYIDLPLSESFSNDALLSISNFPLAKLDLTNYTRIGDEGCIHFAKLTSLSKLSLAGTNITDFSCRHLYALPLLTELKLDKTAITDDGFIDLLHNLNSLRRLSVSDTNISEACFRDMTYTGCEIMQLNLNRTLVKEMDRFKVLRALPTLQSLSLRSFAG